MTIVIDVTEHPTLRVRCLTPRKLAQNSLCSHGLFKQWCAVCNPTEQPNVDEVIDFLGDGCVICGDEVEQPATGRPRIYCVECNKSRHGKRNRFQFYKDKLEEANNAVALSHLRRFKYMSFDGRYEGPTNLCFTVMTGLRFDRGYKPSPHAAHANPIVNERSMSALELHEMREQEQKHWRFREQYGLPDGLATPKTNYCPHCTVSTEVVVMRLKRDYWIDKGRLVHEDKVVPERVTKITKGKYVLQGHVCHG